MGHANGTEAFHELSDHAFLLHGPRTELAGNLAQRAGVALVVRTANR